jgi:hypothetical protein
MYALPNFNLIFIKITPKFTRSTGLRKKLRKLLTRKIVEMVLLDIGKAFDKMWHDGLTLRILPPASLLLNFGVHSYLIDRIFTARVSSLKSAIRQFKMGAPEGSLLAPLLYSIYMSDMPQSSKINLAQYTVDTSLFYSS